MTASPATQAALLGHVAVSELPPEKLVQLADEIRQRLISSVTITGGHLGPNLGVVELTIALHRAFRSPYDPIVWDTGHQAYTHKLLTGRDDAFGSLRQRHGLSGYPSRRESEHDLVENSHASTALSYADGLAKAFALSGRHDRRVVAVVGDGSLTGGMAWEALNNVAEASDRPLVIVLNDNARSYAPTVGAIARHLAQLRAGTATGNVFQDLGLAYIGPVDGHDFDCLSTAFAQARQSRRPVVVHCVTRKGAGYPAAEIDEADRLHTIPPLSTSPSFSGQAEPSWTSVFADEMVRIGAQRPDVVAVTAAMLLPTGLGSFAEAFPDRTYDVGIAEQHAVTSAAGLAMAGLHPVVAIYAGFLNRAFDQVLMDVALHHLPVTFVLDRAGITGPDGPSHHGIWDLSLLAPVPGIRIAVPRDGAELRSLLNECLTWDHGPTIVRFPRGNTPLHVPAVRRLGTAEVVFEPPGDGGVLLLALGPLVPAAILAAEQLSRSGVRVTVVDPRWATPVDPAIVQCGAGRSAVVTIEDGVVVGGFGDAVARASRASHNGLQVLSVGLDDFIPAGDREELLAEHELDSAGIVEVIQDAIKAAR
ncbi:MAG TPA: 1-deoxy-D-xylulose-5-phosphate synthase [Kribbella sp.]|nr:1-deoxy-D-xylulose-5-phosphate synthase [Kribbella sp.]